MSGNPDSASVPSNRTVGRYELTRELGRGAMGRVYLARDPAIDRPVALKTVSFLEGFPEEERRAARDRFLAEARAAGRLHHPNIITIFDVGEHEGQPFIAMEYVEGVTLEKHCRPSELLEVGRAVSLIAQAARALYHAHMRNIVHRDVKPANLMLASDGSIKIADFGLAKTAAASLTQEGIILGTPYYMSPEQVMGRELDGRSDLFSLAVVLYELLTGRRPFEADDIGAILYKIANDEVPRLERTARPLPSALHETLTRALSKQPSGRYANGEVLASALEKAVHSRPQRGQATMVLAGAPHGPRAGSEAGFERDGQGRSYHPRARHASSPLRGRWLAAALTGAVFGFFPSIVDRHFEVRPSGSTERASPVPVDVPENARLRLDGVALAGHLLPASVLEAGVHRLEVETPCGRGEVDLRGSVDLQGLKLEPRTQHLPLASDPPGAQIFLDGEGSGLVTPSGLDLDVCAAHRIELRLKGHESRVLDLEPQADWRLLVTDTLMLTPIPNGTVRVPDAPYEVEVLHEGVRVGAAGGAFELPPGRVSLVLRNRDLFLERTVTLEVEPGLERALPTRFDSPGTLSVHAQPSNCEVTLDGRSVGAPPILDLALVPGRHEVRCRLRATGEEQVRTIEVSSGRNATCQFKF